MAIIIPLPSSGAFENVILWVKVSILNQILKNKSLG